MTQAYGGGTKMYKKSVLLLTALVALTMLTTACVNAQTCGLTGKWEISAAGAWVKVADTKITATYVKPGYNFNNHLEGELALIYLNADFDGDSGHGWVIAPALVYNFTSENKPLTVMPYVGAGFYYASADINDSENASGFQWFVGSKFFLRGTTADPQTAVFLEYRQIRDVSFDDSDFDGNVNTVLVGFTNYF